MRRFSIRWTGGAMAVVAMALPAAAGARPADVVVTNTVNTVVTNTVDTKVTNTTANPVPVQVQGTPTVKVDTGSGPVEVREQSRIFGRTVRVSSVNGAAACTPLNITDGTWIRLDSVIVTGTGATAPTAAWVLMFSKRQDGLVEAMEIPIPLTQYSGNNGTFAGQKELGFPVAGGLPQFSTNSGEPADVRACLRSAPNVTQDFKFLFTGTYLR